MVITTSPLVKTYTLEEFWNLPEPEDHSKLELIKGVLYMTPPPDETHDDATAALIDILRDAIRDLGYKGRIYTNRAALWIDDDTHIEPDLMYISDSLRERMASNRRSTADLVIEVASPSTEVYDRSTKADTHRALGVGEMWLVYPASRTIEVRYFASGEVAVFRSDEPVRSRALPGIEFPASRIFAR